jgi:hypothetical protein
VVRPIRRAADVKYSSCDKIIKYAVAPTEVK